MYGFTPRLTADDIRWVTPPAEPRMSARAWRNLDRAVTRQLREVAPAGRHGHPRRRQRLGEPVNALTIDPLTRVVVELEAGDDDYGHIVCCRPNVALCGEDMTGAPSDEDRPDDETCIRCLVIEEADVPCGAPLCRLRSFWRAWRTS